MPPDLSKPRYVAQDYGMTNQFLSRHHLSESEARREIWHFPAAVLRTRFTSPHTKRAANRPKCMEGFER